MRKGARKSAFFVLAIILVSGKSALAQLFSLNAFQDNGAGREEDAVWKYKLTRLRDQAHLKSFIDSRLLVRVPDRGHGFSLDSGIGIHADRNMDYYRYARPYTARFIRRLGEQFNTKFHKAFVVTSLARTCKYQERLQRRNSNAIPCEKSSHVTGATVDIAYSSLRREERQWMEGVLLHLEDRGFVQATKELVQPVYHVMVYPQYMYWGAY